MRWTDAGHYQEEREWDSRLSVRCFDPSTFLLGKASHAKPPHLIRPCFPHYFRRGSSDALCNNGRSSVPGLLGRESESGLEITKPVIGSYKLISSSRDSHQFSPIHPTVRPQPSPLPRPVPSPARPLRLTVPTCRSSLAAPFSPFLGSLRSGLWAELLPASLRLRGCNWKVRSGRQFSIACLYGCCSAEEKAGCGLT